MEEQRLANIEVQQAQILAVLNALSDKVGEHIKRSTEEAACVDRVLYGNNGSPGLMVRLDRLEQSHQASKWLMRTVIGAVVTLVGGGIWALVAGS